MFLFHWVGSLTAADWQAVGSVGTLMVAGVAALYARSQVRVAQAIRRDQSQPQVVVDFSTHEDYVEIVIVNTGTTTAHNVKVEFSPPLKSTMTEGDPEFMSSKLLTDGIPTMPPGREYRLLFENGPKRYERTDLPRSYVAVAKFADRQKTAYSYTYILDFDMFFNYSQIAFYGVHEAAKALRQIETTVSTWSERSGGLAVVSRNGDEKDRANMRWIEERRAEHKRVTHEAASDEVADQAPKEPPAS